MASLLSLHLMCPVCLSDFKDPVSLPCEHVFCRLCITKYLDLNEGTHKCPECRQNFTRQDLKSNRVLKNVVEVVQQKREAKETPKEPEEMLCPEHEEQLKLFCENDQRLVCLICKEGERHRRHSFKPVKEAMEISKGVANKAWRFILDENIKTGDMILNQMLEISKSEERAKQLEESIHAQFKKMHDFLTKKEEEMKKQLKKQATSAKESMNRNASLLTKLQKNGNKQASILESGLKICQPEKFLKWWNEEGFALIDEVTFGSIKPIRPAMSYKFKSKLNGVSMLSDHFTLGPYESHVPLMVWRDMLSTVKQGVSNTSTIDKDLKLVIRNKSHQQSEDYFAKFQKFHNGYQDNYVENIPPGQMYWEVDIREEPGWELGITVRYYPKEKKASVWQTLFTKYFESISLSVKNGKLYVVRESEETLTADQNLPSRVGVYVDTVKRQVMFCNADKMSFIHTVWCGDIV